MPARTVVVVLAAVSLVAVGCGSRKTYDELAAAQREATGSAGVTEEGTARSAASGGAPVAGPADPTGATSGPSIGGGTSGAGSAAATEGATQPGSADSGAVPGRSSECSARLSEIVIGTVGSYSGVVGTALAGGTHAVQAWAAAVNDGGGLGCHPIRYVVLDDGSDPARHQSLVRQLVERDNAIALVYTGATLTGHASIAYLEERKIPVIGHEGASAWFNDHPYYFAQGTSGDGFLASVFFAIAEVGRPQGRTRVAVISCSEASICSRVNEVAPEYASRAGLELVYTGSGSLVQPDFSSQCLNAQRAGADLLIASFDTNSLERFARSCDSVGYDPLFGTIGSAAGPALPSNPQVDGLVVGINLLPWVVTGNPAIDEFLDTLARYAPGVPPGTATIAGWVAAKLFERAAANFGESVTNADVLEGLWGIQADDLGGLTQPLTFQRDQSNPLPLCWYLIQIQAGQYTSPNNGTRQCT